jgi:Methyltransferase domain
VTDLEIGGGVEDEVTLQPLLLHSLSELREVWRPILEVAAVRSATEIGSESGVTSHLLIELLHAAGGGRLTIVDPGALEVPAPDDVEREIVRGFSPAALKGLPCSDVYLVDGDHNYWTVSHELAAIAEAATGRDTFPVVLLNDVSWPAARRDQYYAPDRLPPEAVHPHSFELGAVPGEQELQPSGFRGEGAFAYALLEGGPRNGVLTAVEDFLAGRPDLELHLVAPVFGLGVIVDKAAPWAPKARELLAPYADSAFLARLERNRTQLFVRLIEQQDAAAADALTAARTRRADQQTADLALSAASSRELLLRDQLGAFERELGAAQAELAQVKTQLVQAQAAPQPGLFERLLRSLLRRLRG